MDDKGRPATIFDVARLANVSYQTVSRVLNDLPNVRDSTRARVEEAIRQLRYVPSPAARALVTKRSRMIGLILVGGPDYGRSAMASHFASAARAARYGVSMTSMLGASEGDLKAAIDMLLGQAVEAVVLATSSTAALHQLAAMDLGVPLIVLSDSPEPGAVPVAIDQVRGARFAVAHLVELGHRDIIHIAGPEGSRDAADRERGWRQEMSEQRLLTREPVRVEWSADDAFAAVKALPEHDYTAIFAASDDLAAGAIHALKSLGIRVPYEVSVVGFDDVPLAKHLDPALTTIRQDFRTLGRDAFATTLAAVEHDQRLPSLGHLPELVVRASTAPPSR